MKPILAALLVECLLLGMDGRPVHADADPLFVDAPAGPVHGVAVDGVEEWLGVPYAMPPLADLRWRAPLPMPRWIDVLDASTPGAHCMQWFGDGPAVGSEDCLFLNVFRPQGVPKHPLPVMVHLHPGGNSAGSAYEEADALVRHGVIVVTLNYRLATFGFMGHPLLSKEGGGSSSNYGLMDQIAALRWVQANIAAFGGDPGNVTLFGFSAGTFDVLALMVSPLARQFPPLFHRVAMQTTWWGSVYGGNSLAWAEHVGQVIADRVGCGEAPDVLACLRAAPADQLTIADNNDFPGWPPVDGKVLPAPAIELLRSGVETVPMLIGSDREEFSFEIPDLLDQFGGQMNAGQYTLRTDDILGSQGGRVARRWFTPETYGSYENTTIAVDSTAQGGCPVRAVARASRQPTYRYLFTHALSDWPDWPDASLAGAFHGIEDFFLWGLGGSYPATGAEEDLSDAMAAYWTNYATTGNPNGAGLPTWPQYTSAGDEILRLDTPIEVVHGFRNAECDAIDPYPIYPTCGALCRYFLLGQNHLRGWWLERIGF